MSGWGVFTVIIISNPEYIIRVYVRVCLEDEVCIYIALRQIVIYYIYLYYRKIYK